MEDKYEGLSDEELKEIFEDMEADYWIDYYQSIYIDQLIIKKELREFSTFTKQDQLMLQHTIQSQVIL